ncbi:MAG: hypothetical protein JRD89_15840, partial [Deltaproteobacteria bacterium]|nr:hypothetical protein [Deltaproteobacteria bacterium]
MGRTICIKETGPCFTEETINAVKYLMQKGVTKSTEIGRRLGLSPFTVQTIMRIIRNYPDIIEKGGEKVVIKKEVEKRAAQEKKSKESK